MLEYLAAQPLIAAFLVIIIITLILTFAFPSLVKITENTFWNNLSHQARKLKRRFKEHPIQAILLMVVTLSVLAGVYYFYLFLQPIKIVSAQELQREKMVQLKTLQEGLFGDYDKAKIYLLDLRGSLAYGNEHIRGSLYSTPERAKDQVIPESIDVVIYSDQKSFSLAREVAEEMHKNSTKNTYKKGKIYLVKDGFEGLKAAGLKTEAGGYD